MSQLIDKIKEMTTHYNTENSQILVRQFGNRVIDELKHRPSLLLDHFLSPETPLTVEGAKELLGEPYKSTPECGVYCWQMFDSGFSFQTGTAGRIWSLCYGGYVMKRMKNLTKEQLQLIMKGVE